MVQKFRKSHIPSMVKIILLSSLNKDNVAVQRNLKTKRHRLAVRKMIEPKNFVSLANYNSKEFKIKPLKDTMKDYPSSWKNIDNLSYQTSKYNTIAINLKSDEAVEILNRMKQSISNVTIHQIEKVQNIVSHQKYMTEKQILMNKFLNDGCKHSQDGKIEGKDNVFEKLLFHGTRKTDPVEILKSDEGFDMRFSNAGLWGTGVYFADRAKYSDDYAYCDPSDENGEVKQMFIARVLIGKSCCLERDKSLKMPPVDKVTEERFDSIRGKIGETGIYIVYDNGKSYPEYLVKYSTKPKPKSIPQNFHNTSSYKMNYPAPSSNFYTFPTPMMDTHNLQNLKEGLSNSGSNYLGHSALRRFAQNQSKNKVHPTTLPTSSILNKSSGIKIQVNNKKEKQNLHDISTKHPDLLEWVETTLNKP